MAALLAVMSQDVRCMKQQQPAARGKLSVMTMKLADTRREHGTKCLTTDKQAVFVYF